MHNIAQSLIFFRHKYQINSDRKSSCEARKDISRSETLIKSHTNTFSHIFLYELCVTFNNIINVIICLSNSLRCATVKANRLTANNLFAAISSGYGREFNETILDTLL